MQCSSTPLRLNAASDLSRLILLLSLLNIPLAALGEPVVASVQTSTGAHTALESYSAQAHDTLIAGLRDSRYSEGEALERILMWSAQPQTPAVESRLAADGIVIAQRMGRNEQALDLARRTRVERLPEYALPPTFRAARAIGDLPVQAEVVQRLRVRQPTAWQPRIMEALWLTDVGAFNQAQARLDALSRSASTRSNRERVEWLEAQGALNEAQGRMFEAIGNYDDVLSIQPDHRYALRERVFLLARTGPAAALDVAMAQLRRQPDIFSAIELASLQQQALGQQVRWAITERDQKFGQGSARFAALDEVLGKYDEALASVHAQAQRQARGRQDGNPSPAGQSDATSGEGSNPRPDRAWREVELDMTYDRILALSARGRHIDVLHAYDGLIEHGVSPPYYVLSAAAGAHQQLRRSDRAVPLYEAALRDAGASIPVPSDTHIGLVYAYLDTARFEQAEALLQTLEAATPPLLRLTPVQGQANTQYSQIRHLRALTQL